MQNRLCLVDAIPGDIAPDIAVKESRPNLTTQRVDDDRLAIVGKCH